MKNERNKINAAVKAQLNLAKAEGKINSKNLCEELLPLLESFFIGDFEMDGDGIGLNFLNGQKFNLSISEKL